jgi:hypothetical protein
MPNIETKCREYRELHCTIVKKVDRKTRRLAVEVCFCVVWGVPGVGGVGAFAVVPVGVSGHREG